MKTLLKNQRGKKEKSKEREVGMEDGTDIKRGNVSGVPFVFPLRTFCVPSVYPFVYSLCTICVPCMCLLVYPLCTLRVSYVSPFSILFGHFVRKREDGKNKEEPEKQDRTVCGRHKLLLHLLHTVVFHTFLLHTSYVHIWFFPLYNVFLHILFFHKALLFVSLQQHTGIQFWHFDISCLFHFTFFSMATRIYHYCSDPDHLQAGLPRQCPLGTSTTKLNRPHRIHKAAEGAVTRTRPRQHTAPVACWNHCTGHQPADALISRFSHWSACTQMMLNRHICKSWQCRMCLPVLCGLCGKYGRSIIRHPVT